MRGGNAVTLLIIAACTAIPHPAYAQLNLTIRPDRQPFAIDDPVQAEQDITAVPGNASLVTDRSWDGQRAATIKDITDYIPGIIDQPHDGAESFRLSMRGSGLANTFQGEGLMVMQDGIPINMADGEFEFPVIDPWLIRYAEVFPGGDALQYGGSNFGGAINFITPTGASDSGYDLRAEGGSFGTLHGQASAGNTWKGGDFFAAITGFSQKGFRQQNDQETGRINANWGWRVSDHFTNRVYINHTAADAEIPGAISLSDIREDPQQANPVNLAKNYQRNLDITRIADKSVWEDGPNRIDTTLFYTYRTLDNPVTTYEFQHNNDTGFMASYRHRYGKSDWLAGVNEYYGAADEVRYQDNAAVTGPLILRRNLYALTSETYAQVNQQLSGPLFGIIGAQESYALRDIHQGYPTVASQNKNYAGFSPRIGLRYDLTPDNQLFTNLSRSFDPPTWSELSGGNNPGFRYLKAQRATTAEIGTRITYRHLHWQLAYYHSWLRDEFVNYRFANGDTATINAPHTKKNGIELELDGDIAHHVWKEADALSLRAAYTYSRFTLDHDALYGNNTLPGVPERYLRAEIMYRHPSGFSLGPNIEWAPLRSPVDLANTLYAPGYVLLGARLLWQSPNHPLSFYVEGRNLFNTRYVATYNVIPDASGMDGRDFYPGEGRAIYTGLRWRL